jgi:hypothetical protein
MIDPVSPDVVGEPLESVVAAGAGAFGPPTGGAFGGGSAYATVADRIRSVVKRM